MIGIIWVLVIPRGPLLLQEIVFRGIELDRPHSVMKQPVPEHGRFDIFAKQIGIRLGDFAIADFARAARRFTARSTCQEASAVFLARSSSIPFRVSISPLY